MNPSLNLFLFQKRTVCIITFSSQTEHTKGLAKLRYMRRATLSRATCILNVSQFSHLGNIVARDKICSRDIKSASGKHHKHFLYPLHVSSLTIVGDMSTACNLETTAQIQLKSDSRIKHNKMADEA